MAKISKQQLRKLYALARNKDMDNDVLHSFVWAITHKEHISELTGAEGIKVIDVLEHPAEEQQRNRASIKQIKYIKGLAKDMGWGAERLQGFIRKVGRVDDIRWLTPHQASDVIEGLKKLKAKGVESYG